MHDTTYFETEGRPAVFVVSEPFRDAADVQAQALGLADVSRVFVAHPIQDATDEEMRAKADAALEEILSQLRS